MRIKTGLGIIFGFLCSTHLMGHAPIYFQQEVNYSIQVKLDDVHHSLQAMEKIEYTNNSPDALPYLYFHLWANAYKNNSTQMAKQLLENGDLNFHFAEDEDRGFIDQLNFKVNGDSVRWEFAGDTLDICRIWLTQPLKPGEHITITTPFHVKIPLGKFSRMGHLDQQYQITQWYPKPAVYDRNGWNQIPYLNQGEFYSEYGTYDVEITLPRNYVLGATGDLVDGQEEEQFNTKKTQETAIWLEEFKRSGTQNLSFPISDPETKTVHFRQSRVHDFAWFCDKRYRILTGEVETPHTKRKVSTHLLFTDADAAHWTKALPYLHDAIYFYSLWNGDYPYNQVTAVDGGLSAGAGMEYPNITVIGKAGSDFMLETVIMHEVGHNWFYGILGSNERRNPWMDEGINSFNENRYIETKYPDAKMIGEGKNASSFGKAFDLNRYSHKHTYYLSYLFSARKEEDQPIQLSAPDYTSFNYAGIVYSKTAIAFDYLMGYLGNATMDAAMKEYFETWKFKHPQPDDLRKVMEKVSGKDLTWFFEDVIKGTKKLDYKIIASRQVKSGFDVVVRNTGQIKGPVALCGIKNNVLRGIVWYDGFWGTEMLSFPAVAEGIDYFMIDYNSDMPEINRNNNILRTHGVFKKIEPIKLQFLGSLDRPDRTQIFYSPVVGWNNYNHFLFGVALYNNVLPMKNLEYFVMPMYAGGSKSFCGSGNIALNLPLQSSFLQQITFRVNASRYSYADMPLLLNFNKIAPEIDLTFRKNTLRSHLSQHLKYRSIFLLEDELAVNPSYTEANPFVRKSVLTLIHDLNYTFVNSRKLNPYSFAMDYQVGPGFSKIGGTATYEITFEKKKSIDIRVFGGSFLSTSTNPTYAFRMSGETGREDYLYDRIYLGRTETSGVLSKQFMETDGGLKIFSPYGQTTKWLTAVNLKSSIPFLPRQIRLFVDAGTCDGRSLNSGTSVLYDAGLNLSLVKNVFEIYIPLVYSADIHTYLQGIHQSGMFETIRFTLNLKLINPFDLIRNFSL